MGMLISILALSSSGIQTRWVSRDQREPQQPLSGLPQRLLLSLHFIWWSVFSDVLAGQDLLLSAGM
jgi:hypothetical protein